ncbi:ThuA domain-containing protein [Catelliglobosispora koreensis]|uniref:ThuA domain-containing protein n=1 Tax=Catelliglobosispora koreensis TaxID=129052 RepID=UPI00037638C1|nr:ThuA domain-containing protein [Catelliglobosispora koreensis]
MRHSGKALIVRGGWEGHDPVNATDIFIPFLSAHGYEVRVAGSPTAYLEDLSNVDLIVQCVTMGTIEPAELDALLAAVEAGTGLAGWHGGIIDSFRNASGYLHLTGAQFAAHPGPEGGQSVRHTIRMTPAGKEHPITTGLSDFDLVTEQYWVLADSYIDVLATTTQSCSDGDPWHREVTSPAIWTRQWGRGRIFAATPGHSTAVLQHPSVRTIIERGLLWAATKDTE